ncbi:hypothetical protein BRARA_I03977 [Brassica rapa]|uniref:Uncharacterized protein n=1 Tax=Brassica campestris TaxID=3711 RepID=A0A397Y179_BRACM|nr:protein enabled homolog [Brassica rapa]RID47379.1 hypothetical protein BRARA_I03977 [Brassica rapa]CAG7865844.1 unnamed protein product [Brassica rapa]VDC62885.1 unnamed protein product [Brassica rapa]
MMDTVFRSAREKLEKEHRESKETGKVKLEREKKDKEAAERQRQAVEASQRAKRLEAIESQMMKVEPAERQREAVEFFQRARRFEAIESQMDDEDNLGEEEKEEDDIHRVGGDFITKAMIPPWMKTNMPQRVALEGDDDDDEEGAKWEIGDTPGTAGNCKRFIWNVRADKENKKKTTADGKNTKS